MATTRVFGSPLGGAAGGRRSRRAGRAASAGGGQQGRAGNMRHDASGNLLRLPSPVLTGAGSRVCGCSHSQRRGGAPLSDEVSLDPRTSRTGSGSTVRRRRAPAAMAATWCVVGATAAADHAQVGQDPAQLAVVAGEARAMSPRSSSVASSSSAWLLVEELARTPLHPLQPRPAHPSRTGLKWVGWAQFTMKYAAAPSVASSTSRDRLGEGLPGRQPAVGLDGERDDHGGPPRPRRPRDDADRLGGVGHRHARTSICAPAGGEARRTCRRVVVGAPRPAVIEVAHARSRHRAGR